MTRTAAILIVGNEILTGKIADTNTAVLAQTLFELGISLRRVVVCPDELNTIADDLNALRRDHDLVFTSGGVGPTHDDITIDAVAHALNKRVVRSPAVEQMIRGYHGDNTTEAHLRMANIPEGAELVRSADMPWPTVIIDNVYVLPGVPQIFRRKVEDIRKRLDMGDRFCSHAVYTTCDEGEVAELLGDLAAVHPDVMIGSYIRWGDPDYRLKLTFDGPNADAVKKAAEEFVAALDPAKVVRVQTS